MSLIDELPPERADVLGIGVSAVNMKDAVRHCQRLLKTGGKGYVCLTGVHGVMEAQRDPELRRILNRSFLCLPDGMPTVWVGHLRGLGRMRRVYGPDFMLAMCRAGRASGLRHFLYGGNPGVAERLRQQLQLHIPGIRIVGTYTPPFRPLTLSEEQQMLALVNKARPDIVWVGISTPKQERFMAEYIERIDARLIIGVGAAFDFCAGLKRDAPEWMKRSGLQWLHRLMMEPRRLGRRYLRNNPAFLWNIGLQLAGIRRDSPG